MFAAVSPGDILRRTLAPDDIAGVCAVYPPESATSCTAGSGGDGGGDLSRGCAVGGGRKAAGGLALLAAALFCFSALGRRRARPPVG